jgi:hypothetical protein
MKIVQGDAASSETRTAKAAAMEFLSRALAGDPVPATEITRMARERGLTPKVVRAAREAMAIEIERRGFGREGRSMWSLPIDAQPIPSEEARTKPTHEIIGPTNNPCDYCDTRDGAVILIRNPLDGGLIEPLHEPCAGHWFDWLGKIRKEVRERTLDRARERALNRARGKGDRGQV